MNVQEAIEKIKEQSVQAYDDFAIMRDTAIHIVKQIDEPEKPVLSKEEAEWLEQLKLIANFTHCLYVITRQGWGRDFEFYAHGEKYKLSYRDDNEEDSEQTKNRLVNALIYGYEVEKEKLYIARNKTTGEHLYFNNAKKRFESGSLLTSYVENIKAYHHTQDKLEKLNYWGNSLFEIEEVKE